MQRPDFDSIKTYDEFIRYYWYLDELVDICKAHGLKHNGGKIELYKVIESYFTGIVIPPVKKNAGSKKKFTGELTLHTGLIECGFTFGPRFRQFFEKVTGADHFRFNVDMVATAKAVKENGNESFTLGDLLDIYYGRKTYAAYDRSMLLWNKFVKDFCEDPDTDIFPNRLKAAAALWKIVRDSDMPKEYSKALFEEYKTRLG